MHLIRIGNAHSAIIKTSAGFVPSSSITNNPSASFYITVNMIVFGERHRQFLSKTLIFGSQLIAQLNKYLRAITRFVEKYSSCCHANSEREQKLGALTRFVE